MVGAIPVMLETRLVCWYCWALVREGSKKSKSAKRERDFQYFVGECIGESFQNEIFAAKHVPGIRERTSSGWTHDVSEQAGFQAGIYEGGWLPIENRELAHSNAKRGTARSKKQNLDTAVYTKLRRDLFRDSKGRGSWRRQGGAD
jgi:hypothetical protein